MSQKHLVTVSCPKFTVFSHVLDTRGSAMDRLFFPNPKSKTVSSRVYLTQAPLSSQRPPLRRVNLYFDARFGFLGFTCFFFFEVYIGMSGCGYGGTFAFAFLPFQSLLTVRFPPCPTLAVFPPVLSYFLDFIWKKEKSGYN